MPSNLNRPSIITIAFAKNGDKNIIPNTTSSEGAMSWLKGIPSECMRPLPLGKPPDGKDMNGILNILSQWLRFFIGGGQARWNTELSLAIAGYPVGAVIQLDNGTSAYRNTVDGNTYNPNGANPTNNGWLPWAGDAVATDTQLVSYIETIENRNNPIGTIKQTQNIDNLAACWGVCDGRTINYLGTDYVMPDWRDKMLINKGTYAQNIGDIYGNNNSIIPSHTHQIPDHDHNFQDAYYIESTEAKTTPAISGTINTGINNLAGSSSTDKDNGWLSYRDATTAPAISLQTDNANGGVSVINANIPSSVATHFIIKFRPYYYGD